MYEVYEGIKAKDQSPIWVYIIQNAFDLTIKRLIEVQSDWLLKPCNHYFAGQDYYLIFDKPNLPTLTQYINAGNVISETEAWSILKQVVSVIVAFQKKALVLNMIDPDFIFYDQ